MDWNQGREALRNWIERSSRISTQWEDEPFSLEEGPHLQLSIQSIRREGPGWEDREDVTGQNSVLLVRYQPKILLLSVKLRTFSAVQGEGAASLLDTALAELPKHRIREELQKAGFALRETAPAIDSPGYEADGHFYPQANSLLTIGFTDRESEELVESIESAEGVLKPNGFPDREFEVSA